MLKVPLAAIPNQELEIELDKQNCVIQVRQIGKYLYFTLSVDKTVYAHNLIAMPGVMILQGLHTGFKGNFAIIDSSAPDAHSQGVPHYSGLDERYLLLYLTEDEEAERRARDI